MLRRVLAAVLTGSLLVFGGAACDDAPEDKTQLDEDDRRLGPGDGKDEVGPGR